MMRIMPFVKLLDRPAGAGAIAFLKRIALSKHALGRYPFTGAEWASCSGQDRPPVLAAIIRCR
jgi:hypothetical protein